VRSTIRWTKSCLITCGHLPSVFTRAGVSQTTEKPGR
jgi:hypothetical protein